MSPDDGTASLLDLVGLRAADEELYRRLLRASGTTVRTLSEVTGMSATALKAELERFVAAGLLIHEGDEVRAVAPEHAFGPVLAAEATRLEGEQARLEAVRGRLPALAADHESAKPHPQRAVQVEVVDGDPVSMFRALCERSRGDLLWLRPDQWRTAAASELDELVRGEIEKGRRSRAIYPAAALEEAPDALRRRAEAGEHIRILDTVPGRTAIFGDAAVVLPEQWGGGTVRRLLVREHALVGGFIALFESLWERSVTVPGLEGETVESTGNRGRRLLLQQLSSGAKDEHIARALGLSLRTVRRRVAKLMEDLGADSRFQAGVEAVRRGWL